MFNIKRNLFYGFFFLLISQKLRATGKYLECVNAADILWCGFEAAKKLGATSARDSAHFQRHKYVASWINNKKKIYICSPCAVLITSLSPNVICSPTFHIGELCAFFCKCFMYHVALPIRVMLAMLKKNIL